MSKAPFINKTLGVKLAIMVPSTVQGLVEEFGEENVYNAILLYTFYQKWNPKYRKALVERLEAETGIKRRGIGKFKKNRAGEQIEELESENTYVNHILNTETEGHLTTLAYEAICAEVAKTVPVELKIDASDDKPDPEFFAQAKKLLAQIEAGQRTEDSFISNFESSNTGYTVESLGGFNEEGLARCYEVNHKRLVSAGGGL
jgi:hypothetical protein